MWWPSRPSRWFLAFLALAGLAGCGFQPLYGPAQEARLAAIAVDRIPERQGQVLRNALLERLGPAGAPRWRLAVELDEARTNLVGGEGDTRRVRLTFTAAYRLLPTRNGPEDRTPTTGEETVTTSFNEPDPVLATEAAERSATRNALDELAGRLVDALARHLQDTPSRAGARS